jgi:hypothetical protein
VVAVLLAATPALGQSVGDCRNPVDWCGPVFFKPETRFVTTSPCRSVVPLQWNRFGEVILLGGGDAEPADGTTPDAITCLGPDTHDSRRSYLTDLREAAAAGSWRAPRAALSAKWGQVSLTELARGVRDGTFRYEWLIPAEDQIPEVSTELATNIPPRSWTYCRGGAATCTTNECITAGGTSVPCEFDALVQETIGAPANAARGVVYVLATEPVSGRVYPTHVLAKTWIAEYRAWKVAEADAEFDRGAYDLIELDFDTSWAWTFGYTIPPTVALSRWKTVGGADWVGFFAGQPSVWSSVPLGCAGYFGDTAPYTPGSGADACVARYTDYASGYHALSVRLASDPLLQGKWITRFPSSIADFDGSADDPNTGANEETQYLREVYNSSPLVLLDRENGTSEGTLSTIYNALLGRPHLKVRSACGVAMVGVNAGCEGGVTVTFKAPVVPKFTKLAPGGTPEVEFTVDGPQTGTWDWSLWCHCPGANGRTPPDNTVCGGAASATGSSVADAALVTSAACAAPWATPATYRPALKVVQDSRTRHTFGRATRTATPTLTAVELYNCATDTRLLTLTHNVTTQVRLSDLGNPACLAIHSVPGATTGSVGYTYTPAPLEPTPDTLPGDTVAPHCFPWDVGGSSAAPNCEGNATIAELRTLGLHTLAIIPCTVDANYLGAQTCAAAGGVTGSTFTAKLEILPEPTTNTLDLEIDVGTAEENQAPFEPDFIRAVVGGTTPGVGFLYVCCDAPNGTCVSPGDFSLSGISNGVHAIPSNLCAVPYGQPGDFTFSGGFLRASGPDVTDEVPLTVTPPAPPQTQIYAQNFTGVVNDPADWCDHANTWTAACASNRLATGTLSGDTVYQGVSASLSYAHFNGAGSSALTNYTTRARVRTTNAAGGVGITALADLDIGGANGRAYIWRVFNTSAWVLAGVGVGQSCGGSQGLQAVNGVPATPITANQWWWAKMKVRDTGASTIVDAVAWLDGTPEPAFGACSGVSNTCGTCTDVSVNRATAGTFGFYQRASGSGQTQYFDDLTVIPNEAAPVSVGTSITATPSSGPVPLNDVDLATGPATGNATGSTTVRLWCNCASAATDLVTLESACGLPQLGPIVDADGAISATDLCDYPSVVLANAKALVERQGTAGEARTTVSAQTAAPRIDLSPPAISNSVTLGQDAPAQSLQVCNGGAAGSGTLSASITLQSVSDCNGATSGGTSWVTRTPSSVALSPGTCQTVSLTYDTDACTQGASPATATMRFAATGATNTPQDVPISVSILGTPPPGAPSWTAGFDGSGNLRVYTGKIGSSPTLPVKPAYDNHPGPGMLAQRFFNSGDDEGSTANDVHTLRNTWLRPNAITQSGDQPDVININYGTSRRSLYWLLKSITLERAFFTFTGPHGDVHQSQTAGTGRFVFRGLFFQNFRLQDAGSGQISWNTGMGSEGGNEFKWWIMHEGYAGTTPEGVAVCNGYKNQIPGCLDNLSSTSCTFDCEGKRMNLPGNPNGTVVRAMIVVDGDPQVEGGQLGNPTNQPLLMVPPLGKTCASTNNLPYNVQPYQAPNDRHCYDSLNDLFDAGWEEWPFARLACAGWENPTVDAPGCISGYGYAASN